MSQDPLFQPDKSCMKRIYKKLTAHACLLGTMLAYNNCTGFKDHAVNLSGEVSLPSTYPSGNQYPVEGDVAKIASNFNVNDYIVPHGLPGVTGDGPKGAFRFICKPSHNLYDDPIVYPGKPGVSHLHTFYGNTLANGNSTYESLRKTGDSTCQGGPLNRSAYWIPAMMNGADKVVMPDYVVIYYKALPEMPLQIQDPKALVKDLPPGLRMVFGYNMSNPKAWEYSLGYWWNCDGAGAIGGHYPSIGDAITKGLCPVGSRIGAIINTADCWDGVNLDSPDHRSHVVQGGYGSGKGIYECPATHPYRIPGFQLAAWYSHNGPDDLKNWYLSSDRTTGMPALPAGTSLHGDWFGAWDDDVMDRWTAGCIDGLKSCNDGNFGDGFGLKGIPNFSWTTSPRLVDPPPRPQ